MPRTIPRDVEELDPIRVVGKITGFLATPDAVGVRFRIAGTVLIDGVEYILDDQVTAAVYKSNMPEGG